MLAMAGSINTRILLQEIRTPGEDAMSRYGAILYPQGGKLGVQLVAGYFDRNTGWNTILEGAYLPLVITVCDSEGRVMERDVMRVYAPGHKLIDVICGIANLDLLYAHSNFKGYSLLESISYAIMAGHTGKVSIVGLFGGIKCVLLGRLGLHIDGNRLYSGENYEALNPATKWSGNELRGIWSIFNSYAVEFRTLEDAIECIESIEQYDTLVELSPVDIMDSDAPVDVKTAYEDGEWDDEALVAFIMRELDCHGQLAWKSGGKWYLMDNAGHVGMARPIL